MPKIELNVKDSIMNVAAHWYPHNDGDNHLPFFSGSVNSKTPVFVLAPSECKEDELDLLNCHIGDDTKFIIMSGELLAYYISETNNVKAYSAIVEECWYPDSIGDTDARYKNLDIVHGYDDTPRIPGYFKWAEKNGYVTTVSNIIEKFPNLKRNFGKKKCKKCGRYCFPGEECSG